MSKLLRFIFLFVIVLLVSNIGRASDSDTESHDVKSFNTAEYIFKHVSDSYEWHFFSYKGKHYSIPLPVILYSKESGLNFFWSNKLHHTEHDFPFYMANEGPYEGKIVEKLSNGEEVVPLDFSITKAILGALITVILLFIVLRKVARSITKDPLKPPTGLQNVIEPIVIFVRDDIAKTFVGKYHYRYEKYLLSVFFFVLTANLLGLIIPLGLNVTGNISITLVLALFTYIITTFSGNRNYWKHIVNPDVPIFMKLPIPLMPFIEFVGTLIKPMVLMIRLFANMFSGHMIVAVLIALMFLMASLFNQWAGAGVSVISVFFSVFMIILDLLVSFIQAYIFTLLTAMYFGMATEEHEH